MRADKRWGLGLVCLVRVFVVAIREGFCTGCSFQLGSEGVGVKASSPVAC